MTCRARIPARVIELALCLLGAWSAQAQPLALPHGATIDLPAGWRVDGTVPHAKGPHGTHRIHVMCDTPRCKQTQERCTLVMRDHQLPGKDDAARLQSLYDSPLDKYARLRAVLRRAGAGAQLRQPLALTTLNGRDWFRVETDAKPPNASGLYAETVLNGRYIGAICRSCEQGEQRHRDALAIIGSLRSQR